MPRQMFLVSRLIKKIPGEPYKMVNHAKWRAVKKKEGPSFYLKVVSFTIKC